MTSVVIDNSAAIQLAQLGRALNHSAGPYYAPELIDLEFANALRRLVQRRLLNHELANEHIAIWAANNLIRCAHTMLLPRIWEHRANITPYDASYVALAELLDIPLVTADLRLARAAEGYCEVILADNYA